MDNFWSKVCIICSFHVFDLKNDYVLGGKNVHRIKLKNYVLHITLKKVRIAYICYLNQIDSALKNGPIQNLGNHSFFNKTIVLSLTLL